MKQGSSTPRIVIHQKLGHQPMGVRLKGCHLLNGANISWGAKAKMLSMLKAQVLSPPKRSKHQLGRQPKDMRRRDHILAIGAPVHMCKAKMLSMPKEGSHPQGCQPRIPDAKRIARYFVCPGLPDICHESYHNVTAGVGQSLDAAGHGRQGTWQRHVRQLRVFGSRQVFS